VPDFRDENVLVALQERARRVRAGELSADDPSLKGSGPSDDDLLGVLLRHSFDGITLNARKSRWLIEVSDSFCELTGYTRLELLGRTSVELGLVDPGWVREQATRMADQGVEGLYETRMRRKDGEERWVEFSQQLLGEEFVLTIVRDVTRRRALEQELRRLAHTDPLTGLFNRRRFEEEVEREIRVAKRAAEPISLLLVDLDDLKAINDEHGHQIGDEALRTVADGLQRVTRETDIVGRIGGDEFAVLLTRSDHAGAERVVEEFRHGLATPRISRGAEPIEVSVGIATSSDPPQDYDSLMREADLAMYAEKR
jgi:diguanylate cyclase (GGDEF)-like protein/PAS domain S-box-containing protein